jgi:type VI secretion system Hcp family effector
MQTRYLQLNGEERHMSKQAAATGAGLQPSRRDLIRATAGVAAGMVGGAMLHSKADTAQAVERDLEASTGQGAPFLVQIDGASQGRFAAIEGLGFHYQVGTIEYRNGATGESQNLPEHSAVIITKVWDAATPQLFQALVTNELLNEVVIEFHRSGGGVFQRMTLQRAQVVNLEQYMHFNAAGHSIADDPRQLEDVAFSFAEMSIENLDGNTSANVWLG